MSLLGRISSILLLTLIAYKSSAQIPAPNIGISNLRQKVFSTKTDSLKIDTISIIPNTFSIPFVAAADYRLDFVSATLFWIKKPATDSVTISFGLNSRIQLVHSAHT